MNKVKYLLLVLFSFLMVFSFAAAEDGITYVKPIRSIDLGIKELTLNVGDSYTFSVNYEPAETPAFFMKWLADESILNVDPDHFTITAIASGNARLLVESNAGFVWDYCDITVKKSGEGSGKSPVEKKNGSEMVNISTADRKKISAKSFLNYLDFIEYSSFTNKQFSEVGQRMFKVIAIVNKGTVEAESQLAASLGMEKSLALPDLDAVSLYGSFLQILAFTDKNADLLKIIEHAPKEIDDKVIREKTDSQKENNMNLQGSTESLTKVSVAHNLGYTGKNTVIAVIDTGISKNHEQFRGRVIAEECFGQDDGYYSPVCRQGSSEPSLSLVPELHNHGSHVTGIAAGRDGIAPDAKIVSMCGSAEFCYGGYCEMTNNWEDYEVAQYLIDLQKSYKSAGKPQIVALNISQGFGEYHSSSCDNDYSYFRVPYERLLENGIITVVSAGNDGTIEELDLYGCLSTVFTVGALENNSTPTIASYSNHSKMVEIMAPGTDIRSAFYAYDEYDSINSCSRGGNCYGIYQGTSMAAPMVTGAFAILKQVNPNMTPAQLMNKIISMSTRSTNYRPAGKGGPAKTFSYSKPILDFSNMGGSDLSFTIQPTNIRGYTRGITVKFIPPSNVTGYYVSISDYYTGSNLTSYIDISLEKLGNYSVIRFEGDYMETGGYPYKMVIQPYQEVNGKEYKGTAKTIYGSPNPRVTAITASPGSASVVLRTVPHSYADGFRYSIYKAGSSSRLKYFDITGSSTVKQVTGLKNGTLYYATAIPYTVINGTKYFGASQYRIHFVPLSAPSGAKVSFTSSTKAKVTINADSASSGIKVMYRQVGGSLKNGCEVLGRTCTISGLNKNKAYEFYITKFAKIRGYKYYGPGTTLSYKSTKSGLPAPTKPLIAKRGSNKLSFTIVKDSKAQGISVMYRAGESGSFNLACEAKGSGSQISCAKTGFNWNQHYTFYIMQFRVVNGKKLYSPGVTVTNWLAPTAIKTSSSRNVTAVTLEEKK